MNDKDLSQAAAAQLVAELTRVKNGGGKVAMEFIACAGSPYKLTVARRITPAMRDALKKQAGGKKIFQGSVALEDGKLTFVAGGGVPDLARQLQKAIAAQTGKTFSVAAREAAAAEATRGLTLEGPEAKTPPGGAKPATSTNGKAAAGVSAIDPVDEEGEPVRPSEIIAGSSGVQYSHGDITNQVGAAGGDFTDATRANAGSGPERDRPMQSANLAGLRGFKLRYGIGFLCADYSAVPDKFSNLADVAGYSKPNSAYLRAFQGMDRSKQYENPKAADVLARIREWVATLAKELPAQGQGELVVSFQGHGAHGSFYACDGGEITKTDMLAIARTAEKSRVSLTYVLDACFAGGAVPDFQDHEAEAVRDRIGEFVEGEGLMSSEAGHANAERARDQLAHAQELVAFSRAVADHGDAIMKLLGRLAKHKTAQNVAKVMQENTELIALIRAMQKQFATNLDVADDPKLRLDLIRKSFTEVLQYLEAIPPRGPFNPEEWARTLGKFQDTVSDGANRILRHLDAQARGARRRTARAK